MAVNPKQIAVIAESLSSEQGRNTVLKIIMVVIGLIMMIFTAFAGFISGLLDIIQTTDLQNHWRYIRTCISEVFDGMNAEIDGDIKREVYDFMPDFSVNLSKAAINSGFDGSTLILYDSEEIAQAQSVMETYAAVLRAISSQSEFDEYIADFSSDMDYSDITKPQFTDDTGIERIHDFGAIREETASQLVGFDLIYLVGGVSWSEIWMTYAAQSMLPQINYKVLVPFADSSVLDRSIEIEDEGCSTIEKVLSGQNFSDIICLPYATEDFSSEDFESLFDKEFGGYRDTTIAE